MARFCLILMLAGYALINALSVYLSAELMHDNIGAGIGAPILWVIEAIQVFLICPIILFFAVGIFRSMERLNFLHHADDRLLRTVFTFSTLITCLCAAGLIFSLIEPIKTVEFLSQQQVYFQSYLLEHQVGINTVRWQLCITGSIAFTISLRQFRIRRKIQNRLSIRRFVSFALAIVIPVIIAGTIVPGWSLRLYGETFGPNSQFLIEAAIGLALAVFSIAFGAICLIRRLQKECWDADFQSLAMLCKYAGAAMAVFGFILILSAGMVETVPAQDRAYYGTWLYLYGLSLTLYGSFAYRQEERIRKANRVPDSSP